MGGLRAGQTGDDYSEVKLPWLGDTENKAFIKGFILMICLR